MPGLLEQQQVAETQIPQRGALSTFALWLTQLQRPPCAVSDGCLLTLRRGRECRKTKKNAYAESVASNYTYESDSKSLLLSFALFVTHALVSRI